MKNSKLRLNLFLAMIALVNTDLYAQKTYLILGSSYCHSAAPSGYSRWNIEDIEGTEYNERIKGSGSFGRGMQFSGGFGVMLSENISTELNLGYFQSLKINSTYKYRLNGSSNEYNNKMYGSMFRIMPSLRFNAGKGKCVPYLKTGLVIGLNPKMIYEQNYTSIYSNSSNYRETILVYKGGASLGFTAALGLQIKVSEKISFFSEIQMITQSWAPKTSKYTKYSEHGVDMLPNMSTSSKESEYLDKFITSNDSNAPYKDLKIFFPFSSIGLQIGLVYRL